MAALGARALTVSAAETPADINPVHAREFPPDDYPFFGETGRPCALMSRDFATVRTERRPYEDAGSRGTGQDKNFPMTMRPPRCRATWARRSCPVTG